jgi:glutamate:GABA antiporter
MMGSATGAARVAKLGILSLVMINVASIVSARNLPVMAEYGWAMLLLFLLSILVFLIPISMAAAELGTGWPRAGGVYAWVKQAFGGRAGFLAVWCDYAENIAWFPRCCRSSRRRSPTQSTPPLPTTTCSSWW